MRIHLNSSESKNTVVIVVRCFILTVVKKDSLVSVVSEVKQRSKRSQILKHCPERSQRFPFNSSKVKQCNEGSQ